VLATARSQQWDPAVVVRILLGGRDRGPQRGHEAEPPPAGEVADRGVGTRRAVDSSVSKTVAKITRCELIVVDLCRDRDYAEGHHAGARRRPLWSRW
jgi:hypothetical protein